MPQVLKANFVALVESEEVARQVRESLDEICKYEIGGELIYTYDSSFLDEVSLDVVDFAAIHLNGYKNGPILHDLRELSTTTTVLQKVYVINWLFEWKISPGFDYSVESQVVVGTRDVLSNFWQRSPYIIHYIGKQSVPNGISVEVKYYEEKEEEEEEGEEA